MQVPLYLTVEKWQHVNVFFQNFSACKGLKQYFFLYDANMAMIGALAYYLDLRMRQSNANTLSTHEGFTQADIKPLHTQCHQNSLYAQLILITAFTNKCK